MTFTQELLQFLDILDFAKYQPRWMRMQFVSLLYRHNALWHFDDKLEDLDFLFTHTQRAMLKYIVDTLYHDELFTFALLYIMPEEHFSSLSY